MIEFIYPKSGDEQVDEEINGTNIGEFAVDFSIHLAYFLYDKLEDKLEECEIYEIFEKTVYTDREYESNCAVIKYKDFYINAVGCFSEFEILDFYREQFRKKQEEQRDEDINSLPYTDEEWMEIDLYLSKTDKTNPIFNTVRRISETCTPIRTIKFLVDQIVSQLPQSHQSP